MATPAQIAANRQNAQSSTGPRTDAGKAQVAQNRVTHGLTGRHLILPDEDPAEYDRLLAELTQEHQPLAPTERFLVEQLAQAQWRLSRIARMEADIFRRGMAAETSAGEAFERDCAGSNSLLKLLRYETVARRAFYQALDRLRQVQAPRLAEEVDRAADARLCQFINHYVNGPLPQAVRRAPAAEIPNYDSKPIRRPETQVAGASAAGNPALRL